MNAFKIASNVLALLACKVAEEAERLTGGKDKNKIWKYRAGQIRDIYEQTLTGRTVALIPGLPVQLMGSPSRVALGIAVIGEICIGILMPIDMHTNLVSLGALVATANGLGSVGYRVTAESLKQFIYFIETIMREVDGALVPDKTKWVLHLALCVFEVLDKWGIMSDSAMKLRLLLEECVKSTSERAKRCPPSVGKLSNQIQELTRFVEQRLHNIAEENDGFSRQPVIDAIMREGADEQGGTLDDVLLNEYRNMQIQLAAAKSSMTEMISNVTQWESGSETCYNQFMKAVSEVMSHDHRSLLYRKDDVSTPAQGILQHLEKLIREDKFGTEIAPQGVAFMSQTHNSKEGGLNMKEVEKLILAIENSRFGVPRPMIGLGELKVVGFGHEWIKPDTENAYGFVRLDPPPVIDAEAKKKLTPREYAIYCMLYRERMRDEFPRAAETYDKVLSKYRDTVKRSSRKRRNKINKAQLAVMSGFMACNASEEIIKEMEGTLAQMAEMMDSHEESVMVYDNDDDDGGHDSDDAQIGDLQAAVATLQAEVQQNKTKDQEERKKERNKASEDAYFNGAMAGIESVLGDDMTDEHREKLIAAIRKPDSQA